jgi:hypothetical protein
MNTPKYCARNIICKPISVTARLLGLRVRIGPVAWISVSFECCVLSGRGLGDERITSPDESYRV